MSGNSKKLIAFNYFGGKFTWVEWLYRYFPVHTHFVDVFGGSFAVSLNNNISDIITANDINSEVINFFHVLRTKCDELIYLLKLTPISREEYNNSWDIAGCSEIERSRKFYVRVRQSFYGLGIQKKNKGWHMVKTVSRSKLGETVSKWHNGTDKLYNVAEKLTYMQIEKKDFRELIPMIDFPEAFFYCDPPYPEECRTSKNDYMHDFKDSDHEDLADILNSIEGKAMISSYECDLMKRLYEDKGWRIIKFPKKKNNIRSGEVQEVIYMNYPVEKQIKPHGPVYENMKLII